MSGLNAVYARQKRDSKSFSLINQEWNGIQFMPSGFEVTEIIITRRYLFEIEIPLYIDGLDE